MKICLIAGCREDTKIEDLRSYGQVLPWWLRESLRTDGAEVFLWSEKDLGQEMPRSDVAIVISGPALIKIRRDEGIRAIVERSTARLCELTDGPSRSIMDWGRHKFAGTYFGLGASPEHCYPIRDGQRPIILFNGWNLPLDNPAHKDPLMAPALEALKAAQANGWQVWSLNAPIPDMKMGVVRM